MPPELRDRLQAAFDNLELVTRLDAIRQERALVKPPNEIRGAMVLPVTVPRNDHASRNETAPGRHYEVTVPGEGQSYK